MALPTLVRTWQFNVGNNSPADADANTQAKYLIWNIKELLKGGNPLGGTWTDSAGAALGGSPTGVMTVVSSCDGSGGGGSFGNGDNVDRWTTYANIIGNSPGSNHSWIVLQWAGGGSAQICIDNMNSNFLQQTVVFFPTGWSVAGTATARPTAADEVVLTTADYWGPGGASLSTRVSAQISTDGKGVRILMHRSNACIGWFEMQAPTFPVTGWTNPAVASWYGTYVSGPTKFSTIGAYAGTARAAGKPASTGGKHYFAVESCAGTYLGQQQDVPNDADSAYNFFPVGLYSSTMGLRGRNGALVDLWCGQDINPCGTTFPASGTLYQFVQSDDWIVPWNQTVPVFA